jgi:hypothetical protein
MIETKLGAPTATRIANTAMAVISSSSVKPFAAEACLRMASVIATRAAALKLSR